VLWPRQPDGLRGRIDRRHAVEGDHLVGHREVDAAEAFRVQHRERLRQVLGRDLEPEIPPVGEARFRPCGFGERGVVHRGADRVPDGKAEHGERRAGAAPGVEVGQGVGRIGGHALRFRAVDP